MNTSVVNSLFLTPINDEQVELLIKEMNTSKSVGLYSILTNILKLKCSVLTKPLAKLINFSFSEDIFPDLLTFANVIPVFKKGDNLNYNNYRPTSLISNIGKLIEKIEDKSLYNFLRKILFFSGNSMDLEINCQLIMLWLISPIKSKKPVAMVSMHVEFIQTFKRPLIQLIIIYYWIN